MKQLVDPKSTINTPFREFHNSFKALGKGRMFFRSRWWDVQETDKGKVPVIFTSRYDKPKVEGEVKGKWQRKAARRARRG